MEAIARETIPIAAESAFEVSDQIRELDLEMARMRYQTSEDQKTINAVVGFVTNGIEEKAKTDDPEKKLSSTEKRKTAVEQLLADMPVTSEYKRALRAIEDRREKLIYLQIERDHLEREWRTIRAFAQGPQGRPE